MRGCTGQETCDKLIKPYEIRGSTVNSYASDIIIIMSLLHFGRVVPSRNKGKENYLIYNCIMTRGITCATQLSNFRKCWVPATHIEVISCGLA